MGSQLAAPKQSMLAVIFMDFAQFPSQPMLITKDFAQCLYQPAVISEDFIPFLSQPTVKPQQNTTNSTKGAKGAEHHRRVEY